MTSATRSNHGQITLPAAGHEALGLEEREPSAADQRVPQVDCGVMKNSGIGQVG